MSAFDALTKIKQAVEHPKTDHQLPKSRSLAFKAIAGKAALQGTKGQHCTLVHGDHWNEVKGNEVSNVKLDQKLTVSRHQTIKVVGNHKETIVGKVYQNIIGPHIVQNNAVRNETRLAKFTLVYGDNEQQSDKIANYSAVPFSFSAISVFDLEYVTAKVEFTPLHFELKGSHLTVDAIEITGAANNIQGSGLSVSLAGTSIQFNAVEVETHEAVKMHHTAGMHFWVGLARAFAGPTIGPNSVF